MNDFYLVTGTTILTDSIFFAYGGAGSGLTGTSAQRQAAYAMAETFAAGEIGTPLTPTTFTGTFVWSPTSYLQLPYSRVQEIHSVTALHEAPCTAAPIELGGYAIVLGNDGGMVDLRGCGGGGSCACGWATGYGGMAKRVQVAYTAGIPAGVAAAYPGVLQGLTIAADLALTQMLDCGADGDPSISSFSDSGYSESRQFLMMTAFGGSPRANYAARMFQPLKFKRALRL